MLNEQQQASISSDIFRAVPIR